MLRRTLYAALVVGLLGGLTLSVFVAPQFADAARNSSGTYSLPNGTTVAANTTIQPSWANTFSSDVATELTNSLDRNGRGAMNAALQCSSGSVSAPGLTFSSDTDTGLYRIGANDLGVAAGGVKVLDCTSTGCTFPLLGASTGAFSASAGITVTQSQTNLTAITTTGNGTGNGITATGGTGATGNGGVFNAGSGSAAYGVYGTGDGAGYGGLFVGGSSAGDGVHGAGQGGGVGVYGLGDGAGYGGSFRGGGTNADGVHGVGGATNSNGGSFAGVGTGSGAIGTGGGTSGDGLKGTGGSSNGIGVHGIGSGTGAGGKFEGGGGAAPALQLSGWSASKGAIELSGANPTSVTSFTNAITPVNIIKAWGRMSSNGSGSLTLLNGFNIAGVACGGSGNDFFVVTMNTAMTGPDDYAVISNVNAAVALTQTHSSATVFTLSGLPTCDGSAVTIDFMVIGFQ